MKLRIAEVRAERGISQTELADAAGISRSHLSEIESGKRYPNTRKLAIIADAIGCSVSDLLPSTPEAARAARIIDALRGLPDEDWRAVEQHAIALKSARRSDDVPG